MDHHQLPFVTILIPCRNEREFIEECLTSILTNGYPAERLEIVVVDGMSDDGTRAILQTYARQQASVRVVDNPGRTTPRGLNLGLREARGSVIVRVDAHACLEAGYLRRCVEALDEYGADVVCGLMQTVPASDGAVGRAIAAVLSHPFGVGNSYFRIHVSHPTWVDTVFCGCYRRDIFERVPAAEQAEGGEVAGDGHRPSSSPGPFHEGLIRGQDMDFSLRLRKAGGRMLLLPDIRSRYYARSTIGSFWKQNWNNGLWAILPFAYTGGWSITVRHLVPMFFVATLLLGAGAGFVARPLWWLTAGVLVAYGLVDLAASCHLAWNKRSWATLIMAPLVFLLLHVAYGLGSCWGVGKLLLRRESRQRRGGCGSKSTAAAS